MDTKSFSTPDTDTRVFNFMAGVTGGIAKSPMKFAKGDDGVLHVTDMPVFRSGTFRDSWGDQTTWEPSHMQSMVDNFDMLASQEVLESVPVRDGHPAFLAGLTPGAGAVVGWHNGLRVEDLKARDGNTYNYLLASYDITEPDAVGKISRGTWRNRSAEVGGYRTNKEAEHWPVYMGVAYVDLPAVEHLNNHSKAFAKNSPNKFYFMSGEGAQVVDAKPTEVAPVAPVATPPTVPAAPAAAQVHAAPAPTFKLFGRETSDVAEVQKHIATLEQFQSDTRDAARVDFVNGLATTNKILAAQIDGTLAFAKSLTDEQYNSWVGTWGAAPVVAGVGSAPQGQAPTTDPQGAPAADAKSERIATLEGTVAMHSRMGKSADELAKLPSYVELQKLKAS